MSTEPEFATAFEPHPLEGSSRFSLLGLLAGLSGVVVESPAELTAEQRNAVDEFHVKHTPAGIYPPGVIEESMRLLAGDDRELANTILGERVVDVMFGKTDPVRVTVSERDTLLARFEAEAFGVKERGFCNPNDIEVLERNLAVYSWEADTMCPQGCAYDERGNVVARVSNGSVYVGAKDAARLEHEKPGTK